MATITEDYVSFETAKLLKEKGFQQLQNNCGYFTTEMVYSIDIDDDGEHHFAHQYPAGVYNKDEYIAAPTLQMAMKWLREVHDIFIKLEFDSLEFDADEDIQWHPSLALIKGNKYIHTNELQWYNTYEQACDVAIKYCLENLI